MGYYWTPKILQRALIEQKVLFQKVTSGATLTLYMTSKARKVDPFEMAINSSKIYRDLQVIHGESVVNNIDMSSIKMFHAHY